MAKLTLKDPGANFRSKSQIEENNQKIEDALENTLSRDGTGPNQMEANLDMNSNRILNLPEPVNNTEPYRKIDIDSGIGPDIQTVANNVNSISTVASNLDGDDTIGAVASLIVAGSPGLISVTSSGQASVRTLSAGTGISISNPSGQGGNPEITLDAELAAISGIDPDDGVFIVGNGSSFVGESGDTLLTSMGAGSSGLLLFKSETANTSRDLLGLGTSDTDVTFGSLVSTANIVVNGVTVAPSGALVGQALGFPNSTNVLEPFTPSGSGDVLAAANENISGVWAGGQANTIAELKARSVSGLSAGDVIYLAQDKRFGFFVWRTGDRSSHITADPAQGVWIAPDSDSTGASGAWERVTYNREFCVRWFGASGDGVTDDTSAIVAAGVAAAGAGVPLSFDSGVFRFDDWTLPAGLEIVGAGIGKTILRRKASAQNNNTMIILANSNNTIADLTIDGDKAAQTLASNGIVVVSGNNYTVRGIEGKNFKKIGGFGSAIVVAANEDGVSGSTTQIIDNNIHSNEADGIYLDEVQNVVISRNRAHNNAGGGIAFANFDDPLEENTITNVIVSENQCLNNGGSGISVAGTLLNNVLPPVGSEPGRCIIIANNICDENDKYGIAAQASAISVTNNICRRNGNDGGDRVVYGGILFNSYGSICSGNVVENNEFFGIDAGGCYESVVSDNVVRFNGNETAGSGIGINIGASISALVSNNMCVNNGGTNGGSQIYCPAYDSNGSQTGGLPYRTTTAAIVNNKVHLANNNQNGIYLSQGPKDCFVIGNTVTGGVANLSIIIESSSTYRANNTVGSSNGGFVVNSAASLVIPDAVNTIVVSGSTDITNGIVSYSQNVYADKVAWVEVTAPGSGYTSVPTVEFTGGGGAGAAADVYLNDKGNVVGIIMTNAGSGYTSAPTVAITGGGGSGATATATFGCGNLTNWPLDVMAQGDYTISASSNIKMNGSADLVTSSNGFSSLTLRGMFGNAWVETGRSVPL